MRLVVATLRLLAIVLWVGGLVFFAFVVAPVAFGMLADTHAAGLVVGGLLRFLHLGGLASGIVFLAATAGALRTVRLRRRLAFSEMGLVLVMLGLTAYSQFGILPRMEAARMQNGGAVARGDRSAAAASFMRLHALSERVEGGVLFGGLAVVVLLAAERAGVWRQREAVQE